MGLRYIDREVLQRAAQALDVGEEHVGAYEEKAAGFWSTVGRGLFAGAPDAPFVPPPPPGIQEGEVLEAERRVIRDIASREDCVIVGRGAPHLIRDHPGVIRLWVHASDAARIAEAQRAYHLDQSDARELIRVSDRRRSHFVQSLVGKPWTDACLYDLVVDTSTVGLDAAVAAVTALVASRLKARG
ncbi:MAG TPA: cytidylate kinase-like family protein [Vicinamibacterales bacterium]|nr:cytidylate kinase-like family protein [Vicinamibacterales bacterium]